MKIAVSGYKSIYNQVSINLTGLTVLSGVNSSGKSSFMQPFLLLKQSVESNFDAGSIVLDGANVRINDSKDIMPRNKSRLNFSIQQEINSEQNVCITFKKREPYGITIDCIEAQNKDFPKGLMLRQGMTHDQICDQVKNSLLPFPIFRKKEEDNFKWHIGRDKCFIAAEASINGVKNSPFKLGISPGASLERFVRELIHIPGLRGTPERAYRFAAPVDSYVGTFEPYVASIVHWWATEKKYSKKFSSLLDNLAALGLASQLTTIKINDTRLEIKVSRYMGAKENDCVNIADVGFGVSQALPILVALLAAKKGQYIYIEQPELHLHPRAQYALAAILTAAVKRGVCLIIETHSSILLRGLQTIVAKKDILHSKVSLNWFMQNKESGETIVKVATLDSFGAFGDWPSDFDEVNLLAETNYLDAVESAMYDM